MQDLVSAVAAAAGGGVEVDGERARGLAWFSRSWLDRLNLDATQCEIIRVRGESMEPTLPDGCSILFDRNRRTKREDRIYAVRIDGGVWELASDNPAVEPEPWPEEWEPVGEVVWVAHTLIEGRRG